MTNDEVAKRLEVLSGGQVMIHPIMELPHRFNIHLQYTVQVDLQFVMEHTDEQIRKHIAKEVRSMSKV